jgi:cation transport regulator ChaC
MFFTRRAQQMTDEEKVAYLTRKLGGRFIKPMFEAGFDHVEIALMLAWAAGECAPNREILSELHRHLDRAFGVMGDHLAAEMVEEAEKKIAEERKP